MTEKIKFALVQWAKKVLDQHEEWDDITTHHELQKLYELSVVQKTLLQWESENQNLWKNQQRQLDEVLENLTGTPLKQSVQEENIRTAINNFNRTQEKFKLGQVTSIEFRQAQLNLLTTELSRNQAKYDAKLAEILVLQISGELLNVKF